MTRTKCQSLESRVNFLQDALLHAIKEEYVEAVEILLEWEEKIHVPGQPYVSFFPTEIKNPS